MIESESTMRPWVRRLISVANMEIMLISIANMETSTRGASIN